MAVSANGKMEHKCLRDLVWMLSFTCPALSSSWSSFPWSGNSPAAWQPQGTCFSRAVTVESHGGGLLQNAKSLIIRVLRLHRLCLAASKAMQALREGISGSLFLCKQVRGYLEFLVGVHKQKLDVQFFKSFQSAAMGWPSSAIGVWPKHNFRGKIFKQPLNLISVTSGHSLWQMLK